MAASFSNQFLPETVRGKHRSLLLSVLLAIGLPSESRGQVGLGGRVTDENNVPVSDVRIVLRPAAESPHIPAVQMLSNSTGEFRCRLDIPGHYLASAEREGYFRLQDQPLLLVEGENQVVLVLNHQRQLVESLDVQYSPPTVDFEQTHPKTTLTNNQVLDIPYPTTQDLRNAMRLMPGVVQDSLGGIHANGGSEEQVLFTLDGFTVNDPLTGRFQSRLSVESIRSMELNKGNLPAEYGKGSAGVLSLKTDTGDDTVRYLGTNFMPGLEHRKGLIIGDWTPRFTLSGPIRKGRVWFSDNIDARYTKTVIDELPAGQDRSSSWRLSNLLRNQINLTPSNILSTDFLINHLNAPRSRLSALDPIQTTVDQRARQFFLGIKDQVYFGGKLLEIGYAVNRTFSRTIPQGQAFYSYTPDGREGNYFVDAVQKGGRDQWLANLFLPTFSLAGSHQLKVGLDLDRLHYWQDIRRTGYEFRQLDGTLLNRVTFEGNGLLKYSNFEVSSFLQDSWKVRPGLLLQLGLRQDWDRIVHRFHLSPRLGFSWAAFGLERTKISGGYSIVYDATPLTVLVQAQDQYAVRASFNPDGSLQGSPIATVYAGGQNLRAPRYRNWNVGLEQELSRQLYIRAAYLNKRGRQGFTYSNLLESTLPPSPVPVPSDATAVVYRLGNGRRDTFDSFELTTRQVFKGRHEWLFSYTRSRALSSAVLDFGVENPFLIHDNVGPMPWDSPHRVLSWGYLPTFWPKWAVSYLLEARSGFPFSIQDQDGGLVGSVNSHRFPSFFELDVHFERSFVFRGQRLAFRFGANNLTNHSNPNVVINVIDSPRFLSFFGGSDRTFNFRIRWLGRK
ncbi:MAG: TonB-dependent receptor [Acidobacteriota bacterium]